MQKISKTGRVNVVIGLLIIAVMFSSVAISYFQGTGRANSDELETWTPGGKQHPVIIGKPDPMPMVDSGKLDGEGHPVMIRCNNCHDTREANFTNAEAKDLDEFHQLMSFQHNSLKCVSCHNPDDYETLRMADSSTVPFSNVMQLCAQCHGPQYRDYKNGSHGGMNGYWDLSRGPRKRNNCVHCHDPHHPAYPKVMPVFPPKIRAGAKSQTEGVHH